MNLESINKLQTNIDRLKEATFIAYLMLSTNDFSKKKEIENRILTTNEAVDDTIFELGLNHLYYIHKKTKMDTIDNLWILIEESSGLTRDTLQSSRKIRKRELVQARQVHMAMLNTAFGWSLSLSGSMFYYKDHATVKHAIKTINNLLDTDKGFAEQYKDVFLAALCSSPFPKKVFDKLSLDKFVDKYNVRVKR